VKLIGKGKGLETKKWRAKLDGYFYASLPNFLIEAMVKFDVECSRSNEEESFAVTVAHFSKIYCPSALR
jgi:hypothetical protein